MPYSQEYAGNLANQQAMTQGEHIERIKSLRLKPKSYNYTRFDSTFVHNFSNISKIENAIIIDGSKYESEVDDAHSSKLVLLNINQSFVSISKLQSYLKSSFPTPQEYQSIATDYSVQLILPTEGFASDTHEDEQDFFRYSLFKTLQDLHNPFLSHFPQASYRETLLGTFTHLFSNTLKGQIKTQPCPECNRMMHNMSLKDFKGDDGQVLWQTVCKCKENPREIYITDFLALHIQLNSETSNEALTTQMMLILEKLLLVNLLRNLYHNHLYDFISKTAFILDGSLAVYSHASWLAEAIHKELVLLQGKNKALIIGVEKTGSFVEHAKKVEHHFKDISSKAIFPFDDIYIKKYIKTYDNDNFYGEKTHFGKKLYYKNKVGASFIINIAFNSEEDKALLYNSRNQVNYIQDIYGIEDIVWLLDNFSSSSYENAFSLLSFAHKGAALSSSIVGKNLLDRFLKYEIY